MTVHKSKATRALASLAMAMAIMCMPSQSSAIIKHVVKRGDTLYGIAHTYNVSAEDIVRLNPQANAGVRRGMELIIPDGTPQAAEEAPKPITSTGTIAEPQQETASAKQESAPATKYPGDIYYAQAGDTYSSISRATGVSVDKLIEYNPFIEPTAIAIGAPIRLSDSADMDAKPLADTTAPTPQVPAVQETTPEPAPQAVAAEPTPELIAEEDDGEDDEDIILVDTTPVPDIIAQINNYEEPDQSLSEEMLRSNILVILPFQANAEKPSRQAQQYADFYRGFLLGANSMSDGAYTHVEIIALDTDNDLSRLDHQLSNVANRDLAVIIAPEDEKQLAKIAEHGAEQGIYVLNLFNVRDELYRTNPYVLQANINQQLMYSKAIDALLSNYDGYVPVILDAAEGRAEKEPFVAALRQRCAEQGIEVMDIRFGEGLSEEDLAGLDPEKRYVFVPKSGAISVFNRFASTLINLRDIPGNEERIAVFGYPDWTTFRGETRDALHMLNAEIYSRFYYDDQSYQARQLHDAFVHWYGQPMIEAVPNQAALGYDTAEFLINAIRKSHGFFGEYLNHDLRRRGVQSTFSFGHDGNEGYVNQALYIIRFLPSHQTAVTVL